MYRSQNTKVRKLYVNVRRCCRRLDFAKITGYNVLLCRSRRMLQQVALLAKSGADAAENRPPERFKKGKKESNLQMLMPRWCDTTDTPRECALQPKLMQRVQIQAPGFAARVAFPSIVASSSRTATERTYHQRSCSSELMISENCIAADVLR